MQGHDCPDQDFVKGCLEYEKAFTIRQIDIDPVRFFRLEFVTQNIFRPAREKYLWDDEIITLEQARKILLTNEQNIQDNKWGLWKVVRKDDKVTSALPAYGLSLMKISPN